MARWRQPRITVGGWANRTIAIFARYSSDPEVTRLVGWPRHRHVDDARGFLQWSDAEWARAPAGPYLIERREDGALLRVRVELGTDGGDPSSVAGECAAAIESEIGVKADVEVVDRGSLTRTGYKQVRLVDE